MHQLPGCRSAAEAVRELPLRAGLKRCGVAEAEGWAASRCFGWAGFQMLRFAQHDSSMSDFAGLRSGGILDTSRWHDRLITKTRLCKSELTFHYVLRARTWKSF